jgi:hypothetical protein
MSYMPDLVRISMIDPPGSVGYSRWQTIRWTLPGEVSEACEIINVELDLAFNCPQPGLNVQSRDAKRVRKRGEVEVWALDLIQS